MSSDALRNLAIVAHIDAGKTTLSERLLFLSSEIPSMGEVEDGLATMDYLQEEQKRGITIEAGIASYIWKNNRFTFFDTPGHLDFTSEMDTALLGVEGALLIISATSGIEPQTLEAWKKIKEKNLNSKIQPILFINKMDLAGRELDSLLNEIKSTLNIQPFLMTAPIQEGQKLVGVIDILNSKAIYQQDAYSKEFILEEIPENHQSAYQKYWQKLMDVATDRDSQLTDKVLQGESLTLPEIISGIQKTLPEGRYLPVYVGSALKSVGIRQTLNGIHFFVPPPVIQQKTRTFDVIQEKRIKDRGQVWLCKLNKPIKLPHQNIASMYKIHIEDFIEVTSGMPGEILAIKFETKGGASQPISQSDFLGKSKEDYEPLLVTSLEVARPEDFEKVDKVIKDLVANDKSMRLARDSNTGQWNISTMGEVQLDVFCERVNNISGCALKIGSPQVTFYEKLKRPLKFLKNVTVISEFQVSIDVSISPTKSWQINDIQNKSDYNTPEINSILQSTVKEFSMEGVKGWGPLKAFKIVVHKIEANKAEIPLPILKKNLSDCLSIQISEEEIEVFEPIMKLSIKISNEDCGKVVHDLASRGGIVKKLESAHGFSKITCKIPLKAIFNYATLLRSLSKGQGTFFLKYEKHEVLK